ncbi:MAG: glycosyltransferase family 2 protein [Victivallales bacterium]|nr:glycosyltransferase family 2 protein [Victivallales bacterium]
MPEQVYIVIPSYNEGAVLRKTVESVLKTGHQVVVVDDGSRENPWPSLNDLPIHFVRHPINLGQGAALQTGMDYALAHGATAVIHLDADGQHDIEAIPRFLEALKDCDIVLGSRFLQRGDAALVPRGKRILLTFARLVNYVFTGLWLTDAHNGYRCLNRRALESIHLTENRMAHATEILSLAHTAHLRIREIPVTIHYTDYSRAKGQKWYNSLNILFDLILNKLM